MEQIQVLSVSKSTTVETAGAVDATVFVGDVRGEVTLVPSAYDGRLSSWGSLDHWASSSLHGLDRETLREIVAAVREAARELSEEDAA